MEKKRRKPHPFRGMISQEVMEGIRLVDGGMSWRKAASTAGCSPEAIRQAKIKLAEARNSAEDRACKS